jgi:hypothetical protein
MPPCSASSRDVTNSDAYMTPAPLVCAFGNPTTGTASGVPPITTDGFASTRLHFPATTASERSSSITSPSSLGTPASATSFNSALATSCYPWHTARLRAPPQPRPPQPESTCYLPRGVICNQSWIRGERRPVPHVLEGGLADHRLAVALTFTRLTLPSAYLRFGCWSSLCPVSLLIKEPNLKQKKPFLVGGDCHPPCTLP